jgi:hypothetical protein
MLMSSQYKNTFMLWSHLSKWFSSFIFKNHYLLKEGMCLFFQLDAKEIREIYHLKRIDNFSKLFVSWPSSGDWKYNFALSLTLWWFCVMMMYWLTNFILVCWKRLFKRLFENLGKYILGGRYVIFSKRAVFPWLRSSLHTLFIVEDAFRLPSDSYIH